MKQKGVDGVSVIPQCQQESKEHTLNESQLGNSVRLYMSISQLFSFKRIRTRLECFLKK